MADGVLTIKTSVDTGGVQTGVKNIESQLGKLSSSLGKFSKIMIAVGAIKVFAGFAKECTELGSALSEVENVTNSVFPNMKEQVDEFTQAAAKTAGLSETMAKQFQGTFGAMAKSMGFSEKSAFNMSKTLTQLSGDIASFYNLDQEEAFNKLKAVFTGETEGLKSLGVVMTQTALQEFALSQGITKNISSMSEAEKAALRYQFVMQKLSTASGDFEKTSGGWANSLRTFKLEIQQIKTYLGQGFINIFLPVLKVINKILEGLTLLAKGFRAFTELIFGKSYDEEETAVSQVDYSDLADVYGDAADSAEDYADAQADVAKNTKKAANAANSYVSPLDHIYQYQKKTVELENASSTPSTSTKTSSAVPSIAKSVENALGKDEDLKDTVLDQVGIKVTDLKKTFDNNFKPINKYLKDFRDNLKKIVSQDGDGLKYIVDNVLKPLSKISLTNNVINWFKNFKSVIDELNPSIEPFKETWQWISDNILLKISTFTDGGVVTTLKGINAELKKLSDWCSGNQKDITSMTKVVKDFFDTFTFTKINGGIDSLMTKIGELKRDLILLHGLINTEFATPWQLSIEEVIGWIGDLIDKWKEYKREVSKTWEELKKDSDTYYTKGIKVTIVNVWNDIKDQTETCWDETSGIRSILNTAWNAIKDTASRIWNSATDGIIAEITAAWKGLKLVAEGIFNLAQDGIPRIISTAWNAIKTTAKSMWDGAGSISSILSSAWGAIRNTSSTIFTTVKDNVAKAWDGAKEKAKEVWENRGGIGDIIERVLDGISTTASNIGSAIKSAFEGAFNGVMSIIKAPVNGIIGMLNRLIEGFVGTVNNMIGLLNKFSIKVPSWVPKIGGSRYGFNIDKISTYPQIPYLAKGAVIPPNSPFTAVLGDQKSGNNIETPESLLREIVKSESGSGTYRFTAQINRRVLFDEMITEAKMRRTQNGRNPFEMA